MKISFILYLLVAFLLLSCNSVEKDIEDYFGQSIPEDPQIFAPNIISLEGRWEGNANFSPDGKEFYFNVFTDSLNDKAIYLSKYDDGEWTEAEKLKEIGDYDNWEPFISDDGNTFYFVSSRPPGSPEWNGRIWRSMRENGKWLKPELVRLGPDTENGYWFPNVSEQGNIYFGANLDSLKSHGKGDLYYFDKTLQATKNIESLNTPFEEWDPFIAQDESYILWCSDKEGGYGGTDIYISFKTDKGWGPSINVGPSINTPDYEVAPRISSNGKILFFDRPIKGTQDIYWMSSKFIEELRDEHFDKSY